MSRLEEAREILEAFCFDKTRSNIRSGLTLLGLAQVRATDPWEKATNSMFTVDRLMKWVNEAYPDEVRNQTRSGGEYSTGNRESFRRFTLHQFRDAGFVIYNDDDPGRLTNSDANNYRLNPSALEVIRLHGTPGFDQALRTTLSKLLVC